MAVLAATRWNTNADMILDVVALGYIRPTDAVIDLTFGRGKWWAKYQHPGPFVANLDPDGTAGCAPTAGGNFTSLSRDFGDTKLSSDCYDVVVFDPPYIAMGGRATSRLPDFMDRFGLENAATTPRLLQEDNERGLAEASRVCVPGGLILAKCAPYISSGKRQEGDWWARDAALDLGLTVHDMLIHLGNERAQPKQATCRKCGGDGYVVDGYEHDVELTATVSECPRCHGRAPTERKQRHARNNYSVLWVFKKAKTRNRKGTN